VAEEEEPWRVRSDALVPSLRFPRGVLVVTLCAFVVLALAALLVGTLGVDALVREKLLAVTSPGLIAFARVINRAGDWRVLLPSTLLLFLIFGDARRTWWVWTALMIAAPLAETALKIGIGRPRPEAMSYGFPSGHATAAAAYFGAVLYLSESFRPGVRVTVRALALLVVALVAAARVMLRAHWPSDVLGGIALGLALASAAALIAARFGTRRRADFTSARRRGGPGGRPEPPK
jgi:membrane-associated phospholipid phosphatase